MKSLIFRRIVSENSSYEGLGDKFEKPRGDKFAKTPGTRESGSRIYYACPRRVRQSRRSLVVGAFRRYFDSRRPAPSSGANSAIRARTGSIECSKVGCTWIIGALDEKIIFSGNAGWKSPFFALLFLRFVSPSSCGSRSRMGLDVAPRRMRISVARVSCCECKAVEERERRVFNGTSVFRCPVMCISERKPDAASE